MQRCNSGNSAQISSVSAYASRISLWFNEILYSNLGIIDGSEWQILHPEIGKTFSSICKGKE